MQKKKKYVVEKYATRFNGREHSNTRSCQYPFDDMS